MTEPSVELFVTDFDYHRIVSVRHEVERHSARAGLADLALYHFVVAVNEVVTNAVRHGGGTGRLRLWLAGRRLHCRVTDGGGGIPLERRRVDLRPEPGTDGGWGLWLARQGCEALTIDAGAHGSTVTLSRAIAGESIVPEPAR